MLTFAIPTWNRAAHVERCVRSIASQVQPGMEVRILIGDDASTDDTPSAIGHLMDEFHFITTYRNAERTDYAAAFKTLFTRPEVADAEWVWTFGDDDLLEPGALQFILTQLAKADDECFFHVAEATRAGTKGAAYSGTLFELCCTFGWIETTGFITGNIVRGTYLHAAGSSHLWPHYARSAFAQSCALLEVLHDKPALLLDLPLVRSQENHQSEETMKRWAADRIAERYTYLAECLQLLYSAKILTRKVPKKFFRYLVYHLWDRYITFFVSDYVNHKKLWPPEAWARVKAMADFLADEGEAALVRNSVNACQAFLMTHAVGQNWLDSLVAQTLNIATQHNQEFYPYGYAEKGTGAPTVGDIGPNPAPTSEPPSAPASAESCTDQSRTP